MRGVLFGWLAALSILTLSACGGAGNKPGVYPRPGSGLAADLEESPAGWSPEKIELECQAKDGCPAQAGLLIFVFPERENKIQFSRCTAFLTAPAQITSNAHCDRTQSGATGYFVTGGPDKQVRRITRAVFKRHTADDTGRPDVGVYELNEPIRTMKPLAYATLKDPRYDKLVGYVINKGRDPGHYRMDSIDCRVRRHEALFPYALDENPDVITAFHCATTRGNSGGPVFAPGSAAVQGVLQATSDRERKRFVVREKLKRELFPYEQHETVTISNLRCVGAPAGACVQVDRAQNQSRFSALQSQAIEALKNRGAPASASDGARFKAIAFQTATVSELKFEVFHQPVCLQEREKPQKLSVPLEFVELVFNEWAELKPVVLETRMAEFRLKPSAGARFDVAAEWPGAFTAIVNSAQHPRHSWGRSFSIDLPPCPR